MFVFSGGCGGRLREFLKSCFIKNLFEELTVTVVYDSTWETSQEFV